MSNAVTGIGRGGPSDLGTLAMERLHEIDRDALPGYSPLASWATLQIEASKRGITAKLAVIRRDYGMGPWERFEVTYADTTGSLPMYSIFAPDGKVEMYVGGERLAGGIASNDPASLAVYMRQAASLAKDSRTAAQTANQPPLIANPPAYDAERLVAMAPDEYMAEQKRYYAVHSRFSGSLVGAPTMFAHEVRAALEGRSDLDATGLCKRFMELHPLCNSDTASWLRIGLHWSLEGRPAAERTATIQSIADKAVNDFSAAIPLLHEVAGHASVVNDMQEESADEDAEPDSMRP